MQLRADTCMQEEHTSELGRVMKRYRAQDADEAKRLKHADTAPEPVAQQQRHEALAFLAWPSAAAHRCKRAECERVAREQHRYDPAAPCHYCTARDETCASDCMGRAHCSTQTRDGLAVAAPPLLQVRDAVHRWPLAVLCVALHKYPDETYSNASAAGKLAAFTKWSNDDALVRALCDAWRARVPTPAPAPAPAPAVAQADAQADAPAPAIPQADADADLDDEPDTLLAREERYNATAKEFEEDNILCNQRIGDCLHAVAYEVAHLVDRRKVRLHDMHQVDYIALDAETQCTTRRWSMLGIRADCLHVPNYVKKLVLSAKCNLLPGGDTVATWYHRTYGEHLEKRNRTRAVAGIYLDGCAFYANTRADIDLTFRLVQFTAPVALFAVKCATRTRGERDPQGKCIQYVRECATANQLMVHVVNQHSYTGYFMVVFRVYPAHTAWTDAHAAK